MKHLRQWISSADWDGVARQAAVAIEPASASPDAPLSTVAFLDSFGTSLMPRSSLHQGVVTGLGLIGTRSVSHLLERTVAQVPGAASPGVASIAARGVIASAGVAASRWAASGDAAPSVRQASVGAAGSIVSAAALGGAFYDLRSLWRMRAPANSGARALMLAAGLAGTNALVVRRRLRTRREQIERWPSRQVVAQGPAVAIGVGLASTGAMIAKGVGLSQRSLRSWLGPGPAKTALATTMNGALVGGMAIGAYKGIVDKIAQSNETVDDGYADPPISDGASGGPRSRVDFDDLGQQGRRFVLDAVPAADIGEVMGEPAREPIRVFVGFNSEPLYPTQRAELALEELERTGAFDRTYLLLISPTGTGWVDHTMIWAAEYLTRGDVASCCVQYGRSPSFLAVHQVPLGRSQFRLLLWGVRQRLRDVPEAHRPTVLVFGESLGAWTSSDVVMHQGIAGFDHYGVDKALWVGLPGFAKWSRNGMVRGANDLVPDGTVAVADQPEDLDRLTDHERADLRATILSHANDPITHLSGELLVREPDFLTGDARWRGVPEGMRFTPFLTFAHTVGDAMNAMQNTPGTFGSFGHDYRADTARVVRDAYDLPRPNPARMAALERALRDRELARDARLNPPPPSRGRS